MRGTLIALALAGLALSPSVRADGLLIPTDRDLPPLSLTFERVNVTIEGQVATTKVAQSYHNATNRDLEAEYVFALPAGASVRDFSMQVGGQTYRGASVEARDARRIYEDIVRRLKDPGLLEYMGGDLWKVRIYPVPRRGEQKIEITFTSILPLEGDMVSFQYLLKSGQAARSTVKDFTMVVRIKSDDPIGPIYSPSHEVAIDRKSAEEAIVSFEQTGAKLDRDFQLMFAPSSQPIGFSFLTERESPGERGFFLLLLSPRAVTAAGVIPRDLVLVVDTSSSMGPGKLQKAKAAMIHAIDSLAPCDRFGLISFATTPSLFRPELAAATEPERAFARDWIDNLRGVGGTDISAALAAALALRTEQSSGRTFQVVCVTDGLPTVGETDSRKILESVVGSNRGRGGQHVRIHTFGVGDDVDARLLDLLAEATRGSSTYVRQGEDLDAKVSALTAQIQRPLRTNLSLAVKSGPSIVDMYPPQLPDLFEGEQLQVVGRYLGHGHATLTLKGFAGDRDVSDLLEVDFPERAFEHDFIAPIWAKRKVGYLLDKIRSCGETPPLKKELIQLAHEFSIASPYTSLLVVPGQQVRPELARGRAGARRSSGSMNGAVMGGGIGGSVFTGVRGMAGMSGMAGGMPRIGSGMGGMGGGFGGGMPGAPRARVADAGPGTSPAAPDEDGAHTASDLEAKLRAAAAREALADGVTTGKAAIDLAQHLAELKREARAPASAATRTVAGRRFHKVGDSWVDQGYKPSTQILRVGLLGKAYFRLVSRHPELGRIFALGNQVTWVSPSGTAVIVSKDGPDEVDNATLDRLFEHRARKGQ